MIGRRRPTGSPLGRPRLWRREYFSKPAENRSASTRSRSLGGSFAMLAVGAILEGLSFALFSGNNSALLYDSLQEENREAEYGEFEGKTSSMFQFAFQ